MNDMTVTTAGTPPRPPSKLRYYWRVIRWMVRHRGESNCRQKWRRMERELRE